MGIIVTIVVCAFALVAAVATAARKIIAAFNVLSASVRDASMHAARDRDAHQCLHGDVRTALAALPKRRRKRAPKREVAQ